MVRDTTAPKPIADPICLAVLRIREEQIRLAELARAPPRPPPSAAHLTSGPNKRSKLSHSIKPPPPTSELTPSVSAATSRASSVELGLPPPLPSLPGEVAQTVEGRMGVGLQVSAEGAREGATREMEAEEEVADVDSYQGSGVTEADGNGGAPRVTEVEVKREESLGVADGAAEAPQPNVDAAAGFDFFVENEAPVMPGDVEMEEN